MCFCKEETESIVHLFYDCIYTKIFWCDFFIYLFFVKQSTNIELQLKEKDVLSFYEYTVDFKIYVTLLSYMEYCLFTNVNGQWKKLILLILK